MGVARRGRVGEGGVGTGSPLAQVQGAGEEGRRRECSGRCSLQAIGHGPFAWRKWKAGWRRDLRELATLVPPILLPPHIFDNGNISGGNNENFNLCHTILIQEGV